MTVTTASSVAVRKFRAQPLKYVGRVLLYVIILFGAVVFALPFIWMVRTAVMPVDQTLMFPPVWIPRELVWANWAKPYDTLPFGAFFKNTFLYAMLSVVGTVASTSLVAFGFARLRFRGRGTLFLLVLSTMMLPPQVTLIPRYFLFSRLGWVDSLKPLLVPQWLGASAYNIFLLRQFMMSIPLEYDEAAIIDGASLFGIFWRIIVPLSLPAFGVIAITHFTWAWNDFMGPLIYLNRMEKYTLSIGLRLFQDRLDIDYAALMAATIMSMIPILAVFFVAQRYFIQGIVISGVKG
jgi:multiple sugar transport system permease protein